MVLNKLYVFSIINWAALFRVCWVFTNYDEILTRKESMLCNFFLGKMCYNYFLNAAELTCYGNIISFFPSLTNLGCFHMMHVWPLLFLSPFDGGLFWRKTYLAPLLSGDPKPNEPLIGRYWKTHCQMKKLVFCIYQMCTGTLQWSNIYQRYKPRKIFHRIWS